MTRLTACIALLLNLSLTSCEKMEGCVELEGEYRLWIVSARERYITKQDDVYLLGPKIESMAIKERIIFGLNPVYQLNDMTNLPGYFILDTDRGESSVELSEEDFKAKLHTLGVDDYKLVGPGEIMKKRFDTHRCHV